MPQVHNSTSPRSVWFSGLFVSAVFLFIWVAAVMRLHNHFSGESFLHRGGVVDSLLALLAPAGIGVRLYQMRSELKALKG